MRPSEALAKHRDAIRAILQDHRLADPFVFGSVSRGEDTETSDLDIMVSLPGREGDRPVLTLFDIAKLEIRLRDLTGVRVDIRFRDGFSERVLGRLSRTMSPL